VQVFWDGEGDPFTGTRPKFRQVELNLKKMTGLFYSTDELLQDAAALEAVGRQAFSEEFGFKLDDAILNGSGAGMPVGIIGHPSTVVVPKRTGQAAATVVTQNIIDMWSGLYPRGRTNAVWLVNPDVEPELELLTVPIGTAGELWDGYQQPQPGVNGHPYATLKGRAVIPVEQCAALGTVGDICLVDLSQYVMIDKGGIQSASSIHVRFVYDEMTFRWVLRTDGQPTWRTTLTPYKGSSIVGPFVTLETRS
jgi:HK97 family phage major capsid protein